MKKRSLFVSVLMFAIILLFSAIAFGGDGNVDGIGGVDLKDVIMTLQISDGLTRPELSILRQM